MFESFFRFVLSQRLIILIAAVALTSILPDSLFLRESHRSRIVCLKVLK